MKQALQKLAEAKMMSKSKSPDIFSTNEPTNNNMDKINITVIDTPPITPTIEKSYLTKTFKGIPKALLEKVDLLFLFYFFLNCIFIEIYNLMLLGTCETSC